MAACTPWISAGSSTPSRWTASSTATPTGCGMLPPMPIRLPRPRPSASANINASKRSLTVPTMTTSWMREARRYADYRYCYPQLLDDLPEMAADACKAGENPYDYVDRVADKYDLDDATANWGIHTGHDFVKLWPAGNPSDPE